MTWKQLLAALLLTAYATLAFLPESKGQNGAKQGSSEKITVHGKALKGKP